MKLKIDNKAIADFCARHKIKEMSLFGSVAEGKLRENSDVDVLIDFAPKVGISLFDLVRMEDELSIIFDNRGIDLITRRGLEKSQNPLRKAGILNGLKRIYVA